MSFLAFNLVEKASSIRNLQNDIALANGNFLSLIKQDLELLYEDSKVPGFYTKIDFEPIVTRKEDYETLLTDLDSIIGHQTISEFEEIQRIVGLKKELMVYDSLQEIVLGLQKRRGFKDEGLEGLMRGYVHQLESFNSIIPLSEVLTLRRHEKDYFMRDDVEYAAQLNETASRLLSGLRDQSDQERKVKKLINAYVTTFNEIVSVEQQMGNSSRGILSEVYDQQQRLETTFALLLTEVNDKTQTLIYKLIKRFILLVGAGFVITALLSYSIATFVSASIKKLAIAMQEAIRTNFNSKLTKPHQLAAKETKSLFESYKQLITTIRVQLQELQDSYKSIQQKNEELNEINARLEASEKSLKETNAAKDKFFTIIGHDLKSPMATMTSLLHLLFENINDFSKNESSEMANNIISSANSISLLLENLLAWARSQTEELVVKADYIDITELVQENRRLFEAKMKEKSIEFHFRGKQDVEAFADRNMIDFVIRNLIDNAIKFTPEEGTIMVTTSENGESISFSIKDTGVGIAEEKLSDLFSSITKEESRGTSGEKGSGIGLVLCHDFVRKNHGRIIVKSVVDEGTTFTIKLPKSPKSRN